MFAFCLRNNSNTLCILCRIILIGIVYCVRQTIFNTLFCKFIICLECVYSAVCWCEMIMHISGLCLGNVLRIGYFFMFIFIIKL